jgi:hypothetical protein
MPKYDFDALRAEKEDFALTVDGETIVFPKYVPAPKVLDLRRRSLEIDENDEAGQSDFFLEMGADIMPEGVFDKLRPRLGLDELFRVIDSLCIYYGIQDESVLDSDEESDDAEGKTGAPEVAPDPADPSESTISSDTTAPSNQTSNVFGLVPTPNSEPESSTGGVSSAG